MLTLGSLLPWLLSLLTLYFCEVDGIIINILQVEKSNKFLLAPGITAKPVVEPEIEAGGICVSFLM